MEKIYLYNTLSRKKEEFKPIKAGVVNVYYCGPTVYWTQHIGNLRGATCADLARRVFEYAGYNVSFVRNYTDVGHLTSDDDGGEDKMEKAAKRDKLDPNEIAEKYIKIYENDVNEINLLEPTVKPRATGHIKEMIEMIETLLKKGYAYETDLAVYFNTSKAENYTALSKQNLEKNKSGAGQGDVSDSGKKNQSDFSLWFFKTGVHKNALQTWPSPFNSSLVENGNGFPGWHIECSAMSKKYLGPTLDIHMGGIEHIPVHHTNEIAQSEAANGVKFTNYWLHNEHLLVDSGKMSKSIGTSYSLDEIKEKGYKPMDLRYFFLQAHYRSKLNFTWEALEGASNGLNHLINQIRELSKNVNAEFRVNEDFKNKFLSAINDDLNLPQALAVFQELLKSDLTPEEKLGTVFDFDRVLGLDLEKSAKPKELPEEIKNLIEKREKARTEKRWEDSDNLRKEIEDTGYIVEDAKDGMRVIKK